MKHLLNQLLTGESLSTDQTVEAFEAIMTGQANQLQVAALLAMMQQRGPTVEEITGAAIVMREKVASVVVPEGLTAIDTCGTGGSHSDIFNVSTAAAIVVAGAGRPHGVVAAKHGNRAITSKSGSAQVLEVLGINLQASPETLTRCLDEAGICFCFAPAHHPAMKHAMPIRQEMGIRTIFNLLGPLTNPAGAKRQLMGVFDPQLTEPLATVLSKLGSENVMVVHGQGLGEIVTWGTTQISHAIGGDIRTYTFDPTEIGIGRIEVDAVRVADPQASADVIHGVLGGDPGPARDLVSLNAGAALVIAGLADDIAQGVKLATESIDSGAAAKALEKLADVSQSGG